jgi:hypothetical protein
MASDHSEYASNLKYTNPDESSPNKALTLCGEQSFHYQHSSAEGDSSLARSFALPPLSEGVLWTA